MPTKEQSNSGIPSQGTVVSALQKSASLLPVRADDSEEHAKNEKRRVERESRNAKAMIRFQALLKEHRSFADPVWELRRKMYADLRDSGSVRDEEEMEILRALDFLIESKLIQFGRRAVVLQRAIDSHPAKEHWGVGADKTSRMMEDLFLRSALHNTLITSVVILHWYEGERKKTSLSSARLEELHAHAKQLDISMNPVRKQINAPTGADLSKVHIVAKSFTDRILPARERASNEGFSDTLSGKLEIMMGLQDVERELLEIIEESVKNSADDLRGPLSPAVIEAMNNIQSHDSQINGVDVVPQLIIVKARIEALWALLVKDGVPMGTDIEAYVKNEERKAEAANEAARMALIQTNVVLPGIYDEDEPTKPGIFVSNDLRKPQTGNEPGESLRIPVHRTVDVDEYAEIPSHLVEEVSVSGLKEKERLTTQSAAEMLGIDLEIIQRKVAELHGSTGVEKIEKLIHDAGANALAGLDYENGDVTVQNRVQRIHSAQQLLIDEVWRRIKEKVRAQALADALAPKAIPPVEPTKPTEKVPAWHERAFTAVADTMTDLHDGAFDGAHRLLKPAIAVLFGTGVAAAGIALHEFAQNDSEEPQVSNPVAEHISVADAVVGVDGEHSAEGIDNDRDRDTGEKAPKLSSSRGTVESTSLPETTEHVIVKGDRIWNVVSDMIADRDLKVTDEKVGYLTHLALKENGITDYGVSLNIGSVLHLNSVDQALDEMEGKTVKNVVASVPVDSQSLRDWYTPEASVLPLHDGRYADPGFGSYGAGSIAIPPTAEAGDMSVPHSEKAYSSIPTVESPDHVMQKGEWIYKIIHTMLRENGLNWSTKRMTELKNTTLIENNLTEAQAMKIPVGTVITFADAAQDIEEMKATKRKGK